MTSTSMELSSNIMALPSEVLIDILSRLSLKHIMALPSEVLIDKLSRLSLKHIMALPSEVLIDKLSRLSLKHVHQLQIVSKLWLRTISSPHFRRLYNMKSMTRPRALVVEESDHTYSRPSGIRPPSRIITISTMDLAGDNKIQKEFSFKIVGREFSLRISSNLIISNHKDQEGNQRNQEAIPAKNRLRKQSINRSSKSNARKRIND
nr:uncharacterized protein LOC117279360 isoform X2 [Nicotiana tomentosiformis]